MLFDNCIKVNILFIENIYKEVVQMQTKLNRAIRYRIYPDENQQSLINRTFGCVRFIWNRMLDDSSKFLNETDVAFVPTPAKYKNEFSFLKEVDSLALCNAQINLKSAYSKYFGVKRIGCPKYKSKKHSGFSYTTNNVHNSIQIVKKTIKLPKLGVVRINKHRTPKQNWTLKSVTVERKSGKYYAVVLFEFYEDIKPVTVKSVIGLDYSSPNFYVDDKGNEANYPRFYRKTEVKLAREQRKLSKMRRFSNNYYKQKQRVAKLQEHVANQRKDFVHKLSTEIANRYDAVCVEDLDLHAQAQTLHLGKSVGDNGFGLFRNCLEYKLMERGKYFIKVDKWFASSKTCNICGYKNKDIALKDRVWTCPECKTFHHRDTNAAINIKNEGLRLLGVA